MAASKSKMDLVERQAANLLGLRQEKIGKTRVRQQFLPLVAELVRSAKAIEITDHEVPVAVLLSYSHWTALLSKLNMSIKPAPSAAPKLMGSVKIIGDLEAGSQMAAREFDKAIQKSARALHGKR